MSDKAFTWRAGLNYVLDSGLAPYAAYSTSFLPTAGADFNGNPFIADSINQGLRRNYSLFFQEQIGRS